MKNPTMWYKVGGPHEIERRHFHTLTIDADDTPPDGWYASPKEALEAGAPLDREALEAEARLRGIQFPANIKTENLARKIAEAK